MAVVSTLPPLLSSDGHLEVRPERWSSRMPANLRERAPRTIKLPDGGDAIFIEGQPPYPVPFLDQRAGRTNETWQPFGVTVDDTAGVGPPEQRLREQDTDGLLAEVLFPNMQVGPRLWRSMADEDAYRAAFSKFLDRIEHVRIPVLAGVTPLESLRHAEFMANEVPGVHVPEALVERMRGAEQAGRAAEEGIQIARELVSEIRPLVHGLQISTAAGAL